MAQSHMFAEFEAPECLFLALMKPLCSRQLIESGEKERLMELLRERLIECGWKDEMKSLCRSKSVL